MARVSEAMSGGYRIYILAALALIFTAPHAVSADQNRRAENGKPVEQPTSAAPPHLPSPSADDGRAPSQPCIAGKYEGLACDAVAAKATDDQARDADKQILIGWLQAGGLVFSLLFSALATKAAFGAVREAKRGAAASLATLAETKKMNAAIVRPIVAIESIWIDFDLHTYQPKIGMKTHNVSDFVAHDWEWQPLIKYGERKSRLLPWWKRGVRGIDLPPGDIRDQIPKVITFPLEGNEIVAVTELAQEEGLRVTLTAFTRCYDIFGNAVEDSHHFFATVYQLANAFEATTVVYLQSVPPGTHVEGEEDKIPEPHAASF